MRRVGSLRGAALLVALVASLSGPGPAAGARAEVIFFEMEDVTGTPGEAIEVPVRIRVVGLEFGTTIDIGGLEFSLTWDRGALAFDGLVVDSELEGWLTAESVDTDVGHFALASVEGLAMTTASTEILRLRFLTHPEARRSRVNLVPDPAYTTTLEQLDTQASFSDVETKKEVSGRTRSFGELKKVVDVPVRD